MEKQMISKQTLQRLPLYLHYLKTRKEDNAMYISATTIAEALHLNAVQVRKDLASVSSGGRPKIGYVVKNLQKDIEGFLGYDRLDRAVIVGVGNLGRALLSYQGFGEYGMAIQAACDTNPAVIGTVINGIQVLPLSELEGVCKEQHIQFGIITVPDFAAQEVADSLVKSGIQAIWNFAPVTLSAPKDVLIQNENMVVSMVMLSKHLAQRLNGDSLENIRKKQ